MADETNGDKKSRLDRIEKLLELSANEYIQFQEEYRKLLKAQARTFYALQRLAQAQADLAAE